MATALPLMIFLVLSQAGVNGPAGVNQSPGVNQSAHGNHGPARMGTHGMVLMGTSEVAYLSHIPMFRPPHDVQLIAAVRLRHPAWSTPQDFSTALHTFVPERFDLTALMDGRLKSFRGTVHRGNFEADGPPLQAEVQVEVQRIVKSMPLGDPPAVPKTQDGAVTGQLFVFGTPAQAFAVNVIGAPPGHDQVLRVAVSGVPAENLQKGIMVRVEPTANGSARASKGRKLQLPGGGKLRVLSELSYLAGPDFVPEAALPPSH